MNIDTYNTIFQYYNTPALFSWRRVINNYLLVAFYCLKLIHFYFSCKFSELYINYLHVTLFINHPFTLRKKYKKPFIREIPIL